ncbi:MAG: ACT domain-containing protein [Opitutaceae bacterium]
MHEFRVTSFLKSFTRQQSTTGLHGANGTATLSPMLATLVMTVIGADRPGLVQMVAARVADHGGNWLESRMCRLGGQFAGILRVEVAPERRDELLNALRTLEVDGLRVIIHADAGVLSETRARAQAEDRAMPRGTLVTVELVGTDRPGILRSVSGVFAAHGINVEELASERINAPMDGGMLFQARATLLVPAAVKLADVRTDLEKIAADLMVDLKLVPLDR